MSSTRMESLAQQSDHDTSAHTARAQLVRKLRRLIKARLEGETETSTDHHEPSIWTEPAAPGEPTDNANAALPAAVGSTAAYVDQSADAVARRLASTLSEAENVAGDDTPRVEALALALSDESGVSRVCSHPHLAHAALGVYADSSLAGCERQLRRRMTAAQARLRSHVERVEYSLPDGAAGATAGPVAPPAEPRAAAEAALSDGLRQADDRQRKLRAALDLQRRRITALVQRRRPIAAAAAAADVGERPPPTPDQQAAIAAAAAARAETRDAGRGRRGPRGAWSPPVPPGLPPGYHGPLLRDGATAVPPVPEEPAVA
jgi:hypothetical protein